MTDKEEEASIGVQHPFDNLAKNDYTNRKVQPINDLHELAFNCRDHDAITAMSKAVKNLASKFYDREVNIAVAQAIAAHAEKEEFDRDLAADLAQAAKEKDKAQAAAKQAKLEAKELKESKLILKKKKKAEANKKARIRRQEKAAIEKAALEKARKTARLTGQQVPTAANVQQGGPAQKKA